MSENILAVVLAVFASSGFWAFLTAVIQKPQLTEVLDQLSRLRNTVEQNNAVLARTHILRFDDELYNNVKHSQQYFLQTLEDVDTYEDYCRDHPKFENNRTAEAVKHIKEVYNKCREEHSFV